MQVPRHWRMKRQLYQLTGVIQSDGSLSLLNRPDTEVLLGQIATEVCVISQEPVVSKELEAVETHGNKERM